MLGLPLDQQITVLLQFIHLDSLFDLIKINGAEGAILQVKLLFLK